MCVYIYIYIYVCMYVYIYIYIYTHIHIHRRAALPIAHSDETEAERPGAAADYSKLTFTLHFLKFINLVIYSHFIRK